MILFHRQGTGLSSPKCHRPLSLMQTLRTNHSGCIKRILQPRFHTQQNVWKIQLLFDNLQVIPLCISYLVQCFSNFCMKRLVTRIANFKSFSSSLNYSIWHFRLVSCPSFLHVMLCSNVLYCSSLFDIVLYRCCFCQMHCASEVYFSEMDLDIKRRLSLYVNLKLSNLKYL